MGLPPHHLILQSGPVKQHISSVLKTPSSELSFDVENGLTPLVAVFAGFTALLVRSTTVSKAVHLACALSVAATLTRDAIGNIGAIDPR
jgi:hypothetical protein